MRRATRRINYYSLAFMLALMLALGLGLMLGLAFYSSHMKEGFDEPSKIVEDALKIFRTGVQNFQEAKYISDNLVITDNKELTIKKNIVDPAVNKISIEIESANSKMNALFAPPPPPPPPPAKPPSTEQAPSKTNSAPFESKYLPPLDVTAISIS
jgi:hypothetical protein